MANTYNTEEEALAHDTAGILDYKDSYYAFLEGAGRKDLDPLAPESLELQAAYVRDLPQHPLDVLRRIMTNPFCAPNERISASKTILEYSLRKIPSNIELSGKNGGAIQLDQKALSQLSTEDLATLQALLEKANKAE